VVSSHLDQRKMTGTSSPSEIIERINDKLALIDDVVDCIQGELDDLAYQDHLQSYLIFSRRKLNNNDNIACR